MMGASVTDGSLAGLTTGSYHAYSQLSSGIGPGRVAVCFGDSTSRLGSTVNPSEASASNNTISVTLTSHGQLPGSYVYMERMAQHEYRGMFNVSATPDANTLEYVVPVAPSVTPATGTIDLTKVAYRVMHPIVLASAKAGGLFSDIWPVSVGGETAAALMRRTADALRFDPDFVLISCGINDVAADVSAADLLLTLISLYDRLAASGAIVVLQTVGPIDSRWVSHSSARTQVVNAVNAKLRRLAQDRRDFRLFDTHALWVDPTDSAGSWKAGYSADGVHPGDPAKFAASDAMYTILTREFPIVPPWPCVSLFDDYGDDTTNENIIDYGLFQGSGGTKGGSPATTGTVADGWTVNTAGGGDCAGSVDARSDGIGNDQTLVIASANAGDGFTMPLTTSIHGRLTSGKWIEGGAHIQLSDLTADIQSLSFGVEFTIGGILRYAYAIYGASALAGSTGSWWLRTPRVKVPNATVTAFRPRLGCTLDGSGAATIKIGRVYIRQWSE